jgi:hypothetical protein
MLRIRYIVNRYIVTSEEIPILDSRIAILGAVAQVDG